MPKFDFFCINALKDYIYNSNIHDSEMVSLCYDKKARTLQIETINPIFKVTNTFVFEDVKIFLSLNSDKYPNPTTILSLSVENDFSFLKNSEIVCENCFDNTLYLLFQCLSGDELHVVAKRVFISTEQLKVEFRLCHE